MGLVGHLLNDARSRSDSRRFPLSWTAYYISFGPHGPRKPVDEPGSGLKVAALTTAIVGAALVAFAVIRSYGQ